MDIENPRIRSSDPRSRDRFDHILPPTLAHVGDRLNQPHDAGDTLPLSGKWKYISRLGWEAGY